MSLNYCIPKNQMLLCKYKRNMNENPPIEKQNCENPPMANALEPYGSTKRNEFPMGKTFKIFAFDQVEEIPTGQAPQMFDNP